MSNYTPDTGTVRAAHVRAMRDAFIAAEGEHIEEFDRWLAEHDAEVAERALGSVAGRMFTTEAYNVLTGRNSEPTTESEGK